MTQTNCTIVTRIKPNELEALDQLLTGIGKDLENNQYLYFAKIASLHMAAIIVAAKDPRFPPALIFESNFDGPADEYLSELVTHDRPGLDAIYSKCEGYPLGAALTDAAILSYLRQHSLTTPAFFIGLPGQTVAEHSQCGRSLRGDQSLPRRRNGEEGASRFKRDSDPRQDRRAFGERLSG